MVDLNAWQLAYAGVVLPFGTHESGFPLTKQVTIGTVAAELGDAPHPLTDGTVPGIDMARGRVYAFAGAHLDQSPQVSSRRWVPRLDQGDVLEAVWDAAAVRRAPGAVATLTNLDRGRLVYGRPRNYSPNLDRVRHGWSEWAAEFHTFDRRAFSTAVRTATLTAGAGSTSGITSPITSPATTLDQQAAQAAVGATGQLDTPPTLDFVGPLTNPRVDLLNGAAVVWSLSLAATIPAGAHLTVDCRPWARGAVYFPPAGAAAVDVEGLLRGAALEDVLIPPAARTLKLTATATTGASHVAVSWRDAFPSAL